MLFFRRLFWRIHGEEVILMTQEPVKYQPGQMLYEYRITRVVPWKKVWVPGEKWTQNYHLSRIIYWGGKMEGVTKVKKVLFLCFALGLFAFQGQAVYAAHGGDKDCPDFASQEEAQKHWDDHGYSATNDPERLDRDGDGVPCEEGGTGGGGGNDDNGSEDNSGSDKGEDKQGGKMPKTAIGEVNFAAAGGAAVLAGLGLLYLQRRRTQS